MYKAKNSNGDSAWFWMKSRPYGPVDMAGFNVDACSSCHANWKGNGDGMLSFNFGKRPVITETPFVPNTPIGQKYLPEEVENIKRYMDSE